MCYDLTMVKQQLLGDLKKVVGDLGFSTNDIIISIPGKEAFGDYSTNIALQLSKQKTPDGKQPPKEIANNIVERLKSIDFAQDNFSEIKIAGPGFINFFIKPDVLAGQVEGIIEAGGDYGKNNIGKGQKVEVEFISANPTGPLTMANGRGGALGDTLANILSWSGYLVDREYYVNDTGNQVRLLGESVLAVAGKIGLKEEHYQGEYIKDLAEKFKNKLDLDPQSLGHLLADYLLENEIKPAVERLGIHFDEFYSERSLYERGLIEKTIQLLKEKGLAYEKDGALWFKSSKFGDEKDRVLITSESARGSEDPTYLMPDIAHHLDVFGRSYVKRVNILGADHHSYVARLTAAMRALGFDGKLDFILIQMVKLFQDGQEVKISKRAGTFVTLDELLGQVGKDVARFFFLMYAPQSHIIFDLDLAKEQSNKNPVYYVQYAHARMSNILKKVEGSAQGQALHASARPGLAGELGHPAELALIKHLVQFPDLVEEAAQNYQIHQLTFYSTKLADLFHKFYENCRVINAESDALKEARLTLVRAAKITLGNALRLMGIEAPERM